ncbi:Conserved membrane protein of uncharacterised function [Mycobacterium tuberculosis]|nr:Conserved membrane protein of uncharacterised function [Mycobacterium tuberculosis]
MLYLVSVCTGALGLAGLALEIRHYRRHQIRLTRAGA